MDIQSAIIEGAKILKDQSILTANLDSEVLMSKAINRDKKYILLNLKNKINDEDLRYFKSLDNKSARELLEDTNCIIEITPKEFSNWDY